MISTAIAIQDATTSAVHDETIMDMAGHLYHARNEMTDDEFVQFLFKYSANLSALTATLVTSVCLTENLKPLERKITNERINDTRTIICTL